MRKGSMLSMDKCGILIGRITIKILLQENLIVETIQGSPLKRKKKQKDRQGAPTPRLPNFASLI